MNTSTTLKKSLIIGAVVVALAVAGGAGTWYYFGSSDSTATTTASQTKPVADTSGDIDWSSLPTTNVTLNDDGLAIAAAGTYVLTGSTTGQVTVNTDDYVRIILKNANVKSPAGAAIYAENAKKLVLELADGTTNTVADASARSDETIDGAIYSSDDLVIAGDGTLNLAANFADGIVGKDDVWINAGTLNITSADDGIRGKDSLNINGGTIVIDAKGDGMKSSNDTELGKGQLVISGGDITINTGDDGIKAEQKIAITGGKVNVKSSVEGIEAPVIAIDGGDISVYATDDGINASASAIVTTGLSITVNGGTLTVEVGPGDTDALDSNGDLYVNGGTITITAQVSSFDFDGNGAINGGTVTVNGQQITEMPEQMIGGPNGMGGPMR